MRRVEKVFWFIFQNIYIYIYSTTFFYSYSNWKLILFISSKKKRFYCFFFFLFLAKLYGLGREVRSSIYSPICPTSILTCPTSLPTFPTVLLIYPTVLLIYPTILLLAPLFTVPRLYCSVVSSGWWYSTPHLQLQNSV